MIQESVRILHLGFGLGFTIIGMVAICCQQVIVGLLMLLVGLSAGIYLNIR